MFLPLICLCSLHITDRFDGFLILKTVCSVILDNINPSTKKQADKNSSLTEALILMLLSNTCTTARPAQLKAFGKCWGSKCFFGVVQLAGQELMVPAWGAGLSAWEGTDEASEKGKIHIPL